MDVHIKTRELLEIRKYLGRDGEDFAMELEHGLRFSRVSNRCFISYPYVFTIEVDRLKVGKDYVKFENSANDVDHIYISRSKRALY